MWKGLACEGDPNDEAELLLAWEDKKAAGKQPQKRV